MHLHSIVDTKFPFRSLSTTYFLRILVQSLRAGHPRVQCFNMDEGRVLTTPFVDLVICVV